LHESLATEALPSVDRTFSDGHRSIMDHAGSRTVISGLAVASLAPGHIWAVVA
jgi:hypothetical protein